jgi:predicted Zn-dependent protease
VLKILELCFTDAVPTLAVTCEARPRLLVNPGFVARHCASDEEVKAVICHEFLHVLLRHTEARESSRRRRGTSRRTPSSTPSSTASTGRRTRCSWRATTRSALI